MSKYIIKTKYYVSLVLLFLLVINTSCYKNELESNITINESSPIFYVAAELDGTPLDLDVGLDYQVAPYNTQIDFWTATHETYGTKFWSSEEQPTLIVNIANISEKPFESIIKTGKLPFLTYDIPSQDVGIEIAIIKDGIYYSSRIDVAHGQQGSSFRILEVEAYENPDNLAEVSQQYYQVEMSIDCVLYGQGKELVFKSDAVKALFRP